MFSNRRLRKEQELFKRIDMIRPTSKSELKQSCLFLSNLDIDKAEKMYNFLVKDMADIPDVPVAQKSFIQNFGEQANGVMGWFRENEDMIGKAYDTIRGIISSRKGAVPPTPLPPINQ